MKVSSLKRASATIRSPSSRVIGRIETEPAGAPGRLDDLGHGQHRERVLGRRLEDDRVARRDRRGELVGGQVEREVERADRRDRADREASGDPDPVLRRRQQVERDDLAGHPFGLLGAEPEGQHRPVDLDQRVADRLAGLERDEPAELLAPGARCRR